MSSAASSASSSANATLMKSSDGERSNISNNPEELPLRPPDLPKKEVLVRDYSVGVYRPKMTERLSPDGQSSLGETANQGKNQANRNSFSDPVSRLFRPPVNILFDGAQANSNPANTFEAAKRAAIEQGKWLLVNLQSSSQFASLRLNRDFWADGAVQEIIRQHFIFLQVEANSPGGEQLSTFYNVFGTPHIAVLDPRTGEQVLKWTFEQLSSPGEGGGSKQWLKTVDIFLAEQNKKSGKSSHGLVDNKSDTPTSTALAGSRRSSVHELSEEMQMKMAIEASLSQTSSVPPPRVLEKSNTSKSCSTPALSETVKSSSSSWKDYLGPKVDGQQPLQIVIRFPNGNKAVASFPAASKVKALVLYLQEVHSLGAATSYELVTLFPKKTLFSSSATAFDEMATLESAGFKHRDTLYLQMK